MRISRVVIGEFYRHVDNPTYGWAYVLEKLGPKEGVNTNTYSVVKCEWALDKSRTFGHIKYFKPSNLCEPI
tara:strand:+ start:8616 stop:8828 length:213 start_codon:yes stop_codon:yes gene_type:complete